MVSTNGGGLILADRFACTPHGFEEVYVNDGGMPDTDSCLIFLAGRGQSGRTMVDAYKATGDWDHVTLYGVTPDQYQWYPMPFGPNDQERSLEGLQEASESIEELIDYIEGCTGLPRYRMTLAGFSAGGVMAIEVASRSKERFEAVVCHSGAILQPESLPPCRHPRMPVLLTHSLDDDCFEWRERYWPMKKALIDQGYNLHVIERVEAGHDLIDKDSEEVSRFIRRGLSRFEKV
jgi:predicted esterase